MPGHIVVEATVEDQVFGGGAVEPAVLGNFLFQLARAPAGLTEQHGGVAGSP
jgi:hypothetical protein